MFGPAATPRTQNRNRVQLLLAEFSTIRQQGEDDIDLLHTDCMDWLKEIAPETKKALKT